MNTRNQDHDTRLLIYRSRQVVLALFILLVSIAFGVYIREGMEKGMHWIAIGAPLCLTGLTFLLYPATEEWEYKPWQSKPTMIEQHFER